MSDDKEDLELEALQRRLDDAFGTTRPRRDFEDELWLRMQARRPATARLRDAFAAAMAGFREAPAIPLGAVAMLLIVAVGIGVLATGGLHLNQSSTSGAFSQAAPADLAAGQFGRLPTPALHPGSVDRVPTGLSAAPEAPASSLFFGPTNLRWTGTLQAVPPAPVYRYSEPGAASADQFAASLGASTVQQPLPAFALGTYSAQDFTLIVGGTAPQLPRAPYYALTQTTAFGGHGQDPQTVAIDYLDRYSLAPASPSPPEVRQTLNGTRVLFPRSFSLQTPSGAAFLLVDWNGEHSGIEVDLQDGQVKNVTGPLPLSLDSASYRLISADQAVQQALTQAPASSQGTQPLPTVDLTHAELVYALAVSNGQGFYEPAYLFSGTFQYNGQTYTRRVLVPLVDPSQRS